ncbi:MAG: Holliday junction branch migration protein RuvA [Rhodobacterales bacterium]|nr:MAG: Holliday junction branch migration protein RuvA [Rhodobacterales bacterium]
MIGKISGRLEYRAADHVLIDVRGVGYMVYVSERTMAAMPAAGQQVALFTELLVREDILQLFGFPTLLEKEWHRLLVGVQGIGAKASLAILGTLGAEGVSRAIALGDVNAVKMARGVGPKTAQRVVLELKDKAPAVMAMGDTAAAPTDLPEDSAPVIESDSPPVAPPSAAPSTANAQSDALSALANLGYSPSDAAMAVAQAAGDLPDADTGDLIRAALKLLAPKG